MKTCLAQRLIRGSSTSAWLLLTSPMLIAQGTTPSTLAPASTPAHQIFDLSLFVIAITGGIFLAVGGLLAVALYRFRARKNDALGEPAQIYGSTQIELAWTVIPVLIVVVLFLTTARIIFAIQDAEKPKTALTPAPSSSDQLRVKSRVSCPFQLDLRRGFFEGTHIVES